MRSPARYGPGFADSFGGYGGRTGYSFSLLVQRERTKEKRHSGGEDCDFFPSRDPPYLKRPRGAIPSWNTPGLYTFARGFCISQVSPPGGDKPRPYTITEGSRSNRRGDSRIARRSRSSVGARGRAPTGAAVPNMVGALKRLVHREIGGKIFQRSYHEHVIWGEEDYRLIWEYIDTNPAKWAEDRYFDP